MAKEEFDLQSIMTEALGKTYIFVPSEGKDMRVEYPELNTVEAFSQLSNNELVFVWLYANRTSPISIHKKVVDAERKKNVIKALNWSGIISSLDQSTISNYKDEKFPAKITLAVQKMTSYNPSVRMKAKMISEKALNNISRMVDVAEEDFDKMELGEKKQYAELVKTITNTLDELVVANEEAYGVKVIKKREAKATNQGATLMDILQSQE